ncbi:MAG: deoxyribonuclease IV, partial [Nitrospirae bacterium]
SRSVRMLAYELETLERLNAHYLVLHPGRAVGQPLGEAIEIASKGIRDAVKASGVKKRILLENTAGQRGDISSSIENLSEIAQRAGADSIAGICIDTCHAFQAGYNITTTEGVAELLDKVKTLLSPLRIELIHLNDSKRPFSSGLDRHEHIGRGYIGMEGFCRFLNRKEIKGIPLILETPKNTEKDDMENLLKVKALFEDNGC